MPKLFSTPDSESTRSFYSDLAQGRLHLKIWGKERRFNPFKISTQPSVQKYYLETIRPYLSLESKVLDFGCGPGSFLFATSPLCKEIIGVDLSSDFIHTAEIATRKLELKNVSFFCVEEGELPFPKASFDQIILVDTLHHLANINNVMHQLDLVLKPGGTLLIFEPNKANPLLALLCLFDRNEWGLLRLGTKKKYREILLPHYQVLKSSFNGLLVGPDHFLFLAIVSFLNHRWIQPWLGWLNPKIFIVAKKTNE